jgi:hypothetical protein
MLLHPPHAPPLLPPKELQVAAPTAAYVVYESVLGMLLKSTVPG